MAPLSETEKQRAKLLLELEDAEEELWLWEVHEHDSVDGSASVRKLRHLITKLQKQLDKLNATTV